MEGEVFEDGETILDVLWKRNLRGDEVLGYKQPPDYNGLGYISNQEFGKLKTHVVYFEYIHNIPIIPSRF